MKDDKKEIIIKKEKKIYSKDFMEIGEFVFTLVSLSSKHIHFLVHSKNRELTTEDPIESFKILADFNNNIDGICSEINIRYNVICDDVYSPAIKVDEKGGQFKISLLIRLISNEEFEGYCFKKYPLFKESINDNLTLNTTFTVDSRDDSAEALLASVFNETVNNTKSSSRTIAVATLTELYIKNEPSLYVYDDSCYIDITVSNYDIENRTIRGLCTIFDLAIEKFNLPTSAQTLYSNTIYSYFENRMRFNINYYTNSFTSIVNAYPNTVVVVDDESNLVYHFKDKAIYNGNILVLVYDVYDKESYNAVDLDENLPSREIIRAYIARRYQYRYSNLFIHDTFTVSYKDQILYIKEIKIDEYINVKFKEEYEKIILSKNKLLTTNVIYTSELNMREKYPSLSNCFTKLIYNELEDSNYFIALREIKGDELLDNTLDNQIYQFINNKFKGYKITHMDGMWTFFKNTVTYQAYKIEIL